MLINILDSTIISIILGIAVQGKYFDCKFDPLPKIFLPSLPVQHYSNFDIR